MSFVLFLILVSFLFDKFSYSSNNVEQKLSTQFKRDSFLCCFATEVLTIVKDFRRLFSVYAPPNFTVENIMKRMKTKLDSFLLEL